VNYKRRQEKPEAVSSGFKVELPQASGSSTQRITSNILRLFARPEGCPQYYYLKFNVGGVGVFSICAGVASGGRHTVVICAVLQPDGRITERPNSDTVKPSKEKKPTVRPKTAVGMD
jgi:hypothetical protein